MLNTKKSIRIKLVNNELKRGVWGWILRLFLLYYGNIELKLLNPFGDNPI